MPRRTPLAAAAALAAGLLVATTMTASAQLPPLTQQPPPPTTEPPPPEQAPSQPTPGPAPPTDDRSGGGSGDAGAAPGAGVNQGQIPPEYRALIASVRRSPANNTKRLMAALTQLEPFGLDAQRAAIVGMGRFPVAGIASFVDDWWFPRFVPTFHLHVGTDVFAAYGTPVRAPVDGRVRITNGAVGGLAVYVTMSDRTYFYMAHLSGLAAGLTEGQQVRTGDVVGFVGDSGNARGGAPHVHFEIHPRGGPPIDPKPYLDKFIADATAQVPLLVDYYRRLAAARQPAAAPTPVIPPAPAPPPVVRLCLDRPAAAPLLWAASMGPTTGALGLAESELVTAARTVDWSTRVPAVDVGAQALVRAVLTPLTPNALASLL